jgi:hypothetical protein
MATVQEILNTELPKPTFSLTPGIKAPIPSQMTFSRADNSDGTARTFDPRTQKFSARNADKPRVYGDQQGLLIERFQATNHLLWSAAINSTNWDLSDIATATKESIIEGETAYKLTGQNNNNFAQALQDGDPYRSRGACDIIIEEPQSNASETTRLALGNQNFDYLGNISWDWVNETATLTKENAHLYMHGGGGVVMEQGPNGGRVVILRIGYELDNDDTTLPEPQGTHGRRILINPDTDGQNRAIIAHHAQWVDKRTARALPIVNQGSQTTRAADNATIFNVASASDQPEWYNPNEGTFFLKYIPLTFGNSGETGVANESKLITTDSSPRIRLANDTSYKDAYEASDPVVDASSPTPFGVDKVAMSYRIGGDIILGANGKTAKASGASGWDGITELKLGNDLRPPTGVYLAVQYSPKAIDEPTAKTLSS